MPVGPAASRGADPPWPEAREIVTGLPHQASGLLEVLDRLGRPALRDPQPPTAVHVHGDVAFRAMACADARQHAIGLCQAALLGERHHQGGGRDGNAEVAVMRFGEFQHSPRVLLGVRKRATAAGDLGPGAGGERELTGPVPALRAIQDAQQPAISLVKAVGELECPDRAVDQPETVNCAQISRPKGPVRERDHFGGRGAGGGRCIRGEAQQIKLGGRASLAGYRDRLAEPLGGDAACAVVEQ